MKRVLVATDLSERSERAVRRAFQIAEQHEAALTVLSVVDSDLPSDLASEFKTRTEAQLDRYCRSISQYPHDVVVEIDDPLMRIHAVARAVDADLVVLGIHRPRPIADFFRGTTLVRLVRNSLRPVLVVTKPVEQTYRKPLCGLDFSPSSVAAASAAAALCPDVRIATFHAVHVPFRGFLAPGGTAAETQPFIEEGKQRLADWLPDAGLPQQCDEPVVIAEDVPQALRKMMAATEADLIALGAHGRASLAPTHLGGFAEGLLAAPPCDVLVVRR